MSAGRVLNSLDEKLGEPVQKQIADRSDKTNNIAQFVFF